MDNKYTLSDVETSLNYGRPLSKANRRLVTAMFVLLCIMEAVLVVSAVIACVLVDASERTELWIFAPVCVIVFSVIIIIRWALSKCNRNEKQIEACFDDALETRARIRYEPHVFNDGSNVSTHVVYFSVNGVDYAVVSQNTAYTTVGKRKDLEIFEDETCSILYSPKCNDVLVLKSKPNEEIL